MATTYKRLGALDGNGVIGTAATLYTVPDSTSTIVSTISICNRAAVAATYSIGVSTTTSYSTAGTIISSATVAANDTVFLTLGITLDTTNKYLLCSSSASTVSFNAFGSEIV